MRKLSTCIGMALLAVAAGSTPVFTYTSPISGAHAATAQSTWLRVDSFGADLTRDLNGTRAIDYGDFQWLPAEDVNVSDLRALGYGVVEVQAPFALTLGGMVFDPLDQLPPVRAGWERSGGAGPDLRMVQFDGPVRPEWLADLKQQGIEPVQYIHPFTYVVWSDQAQLQAAGQRSGVRWTGDFLPEYKVGPANRHLGPAERDAVVLFSRSANEAELVAQLAANGAQVDLVEALTGGLAIAYLRTSGDSFQAMSRIAGVYSVQDAPNARDGEPRAEMTAQSVVGNHGPAPTYTIFPGYQSWLAASGGYLGDGVTVGIVDGGIRTTHVDLASNIEPCVNAGGGGTSSCTTANNLHGTHVAGAVGGTGTTGTLLNGFLRGQGVAPAAGLIQQRYSGPTMLRIFKESALSGAVLANNSWGPADTPQGYDFSSLQVDIIARDANPDTTEHEPILPVWSVMNGYGDNSQTMVCAPSSLGSPDEAKNLFGIGSTTLLTSAGVQSSSIFHVSFQSGHGPACDGRRLPHMVAPGCFTDSTTSTSDTAHSFSGFCGTSMASPVVSGGVALFIEKFRDENEGHTPSPALSIAAFTAIATNLNGFTNADGNPMGHRPDRFQGYGRMDLDAVINPPQPMYAYDQEHVFTASGQTWARSFEAVDPSQPIHIMLVWTDAHGHGLGGGNPTPAWVNGLDLSVETNTGTYLGNVIGGDGWSALGGAPDPANNHEGVFLSPAQHNGAITINVLAANIAADALNPHSPNATSPRQDFALVCYNCVEGEGPGPVDQADLSVNLFALPDPVEIGGELVLISQIANFGPDTALGVQVELELPAELAFESGRTVVHDRGFQRGNAATWACAEDEGTVTCDLSESLPSATLAPTLEVVTSVRPQAMPGVVETTVEVSSNTVDPVPGNNSASVETEITGKPDSIFADGFECIDGISDCPDPNIVVGTLDETIPDDFGGLSVDWLTGEAIPGEIDDFHFNPYRSNNPDLEVLSFWWGMGNEAAAGVSDGTNYLVLQSGDTIGPASNFIISAQGPPTINWRQAGGVDGYLGFRFTNTNTGVTNYGYVRMTTTGTDGFPAMLLDYAYNQAGAPITIP